MSEEQLNAFLEKVKSDISLQEKLNGAADADAVVAIAKEAGFSLTAEDLKMGLSKVSDAELETAAGGKDVDPTCVGFLSIWRKDWKPLF